MKRLRVLIFSATFGAGHVRAAQAMIEAIYSKVPDAEVTHLDFGAVLSKTFNKVIKNTYIEVIKHTPRLWGKFYYRTAKIQHDSVFQRLINGLGRKDFLRYIENFRPDVIICTYPTVAGVLARLRLKQILGVPVVTVVTDYAVHGQWVHPGVDLYIVGCEAVFQDLVAKGISPERIQITGIPVSPKFETQLDKAEITARLGLLPNRVTFLVMGGAYGVLGGAKWLCKILADAEYPVQTIVVCGQDEKLYKSLDSVIAEARNPVIKFGFVNNVEELMTAADVIITKAGGLTVSEALTKRLPLVIYRPIPGQEEENAAFIEKIRAGKVAETESELEQIIKGLLEKPEEIQTLKRAAGYALPGRAAERAVEHILNLLENKREIQRIG